LSQSQKWDRWVEPAASEAIFHFALQRATHVSIDILHAWSDLALELD
jgi:hypothetical protein